MDTRIQESEWNADKEKIFLTTMAIGSLTFASYLAQLQTKNITLGKFTAKYNKEPVMLRYVFRLMLTYPTKDLSECRLLCEPSCLRNLWFQIVHADFSYSFLD